MITRNARSSVAASHTMSRVHKARIYVGLRVSPQFQLSCASEVLSSHESNPYASVHTSHFVPISFHTPLEWIKRKAMLLSHALLVPHLLDACRHDSIPNVLFRVTGNQLAREYLLPSAILGVGFHLGIEVASMEIHSCA